MLYNQRQQYAGELAGEHPNNSTHETLVSKALKKLSTSSVLHDMQQQQQAGGAWANTQAEGGQGEQQQRALPQQSLLPDPKEDANRVIEDILAVSTPHVSEVSPK